MSLPILSSLFFEKHMPDVGFFSKWHSLLPWNDRMLPVYEWQGILYVGCSVPPNEFPQVSTNIVYVLCESEALKQVWYEYQGTVVANVKVPRSKARKAKAIDEAPEGLSLDLKIASAPDDQTLNILDVKPSDDFTSLLSEDTVALSADEEHSDEEQDPVESEESDESLELLNLDLSPGISNPLSDKTSVFGLKPITEEEDINFPPVLKSSPATGLPETTDDEITEEIEIKDLRKDPPKPRTPHVTIRSETVTGFTNEERAAAAEQRATPSRTEVLLNSNQNEKEEVTKSSITALTQTYSGSPDSEMLDIFSEMEATFPKVMVLLKNGDQIKPWKWNQNFHGPSQEGLGYSLIPPSPLRIVYRTHMPYHGHVVPNDFNAKFFRDWNESQIPEHLTITPILVNDHLIGMLLGISKKPKEDQLSLLMAERVAEKLTKQIKTRPKSSKVAS